MDILAERIVIAGAEGYLGQEAVRHFGSIGMRTLASCRTAADGERVKAFVQREGLAGRVTVEVADLSDEPAVVRLAEASAKHGAPQVVFNCAGGFRTAALTETSLADFEFLVGANLRTCFLLARHFVPRMQKNGFGRVVFVSSAATLAPAGRGVGVYAATKAGINAFVQSLAAENHRSGVTVNAIAPTIIDTPANRQAMPDADPLDWVPVESILRLAGMLIGRDGAPYNGAVIPIVGKI